MGTKISTASTNPIVMDSRKFLAAINNSAQARVTVFEDIVRKLGQKLSESWRLIALNNDKLIIENVTRGGYLLATHRRLRGGALEVAEVRPIRIVQEQKQELFAQTCHALVEAIEHNDRRAMRTTFNSLAAQRFTPFTVPRNGNVLTKDGLAHHIPFRQPLLTEDQQERLVAALAASVADSVILENGRVVSAVFADRQRPRIPISEWACRKVVGDKMRRLASEAYLSKGFRDRLYQVAKLVTEEKVAEAVDSIKGFLAEQQEFCLLTRKECQTLVENALAAHAVFNQQLCADVATLFYRVNLRVNRESILKEWAQTAKRAQHPTLLENVRVLGESKNFEQSYDRFLRMAFVEAVSPRDEELQAYRTALDLLKDSPRLNEDQELKGKVTELLERLSDPNVDDETVQLVRETLASAKQETDALTNLSDYDEIPGTTTTGGTAPTGMKPGVPNIIINAPLINVGGESPPPASTPPVGGETDLGDLDLGGEKEPSGKDEGDQVSEPLDLGDLGGESKRGSEEGEDFGLDLGNEGEEDEDEERRKAKQVDIHLDSQQRLEPPLNEDELIARALGDLPNDPYVCQEDIRPVAQLGSDYGRPILAQDLSDVVATMIAVAEERGLRDNELLLHGNELAEEALKRNSLRIPVGKQNAALDEAVAELERRLMEDQFKFGTRLRRRGMRRSSINALERGKTPISARKSESGFVGSAPSSKGLPMESKLVWSEHDEANQGVMGSLGGVNFILDYANPAAVLSEDGTSVEVPLSDDLASSALASAGLAAGDPKLFERWIAGGIEQFRPLTEQDERELSEAVATITATTDGQITVAVDSDTEVQQIGEPTGELGEPGELEEPERLGGLGELGAELEPVGAGPAPPEPEEMQPVGDEPAEPSELPTDEMPDFTPKEFGGEEKPGEGEEAKPGEEEEEEEEGEGGEEEVKEEEEEPVAEDKDITDPTKPGYATLVKGDKRETPKESGKAVKQSKGKRLEGFERQQMPSAGSTSLKPIKK